MAPSATRRILPAAFTSALLALLFGTCSGDKQQAFDPAAAGDALYESILSGATRTNDEVDTHFGL